MMINGQFNGINCDSHCFVGSCRFIACPSAMLFQLMVVEDFYLCILRTLITQSICNPWNQSTNISQCISAILNRCSASCQFACSIHVPRFFRCHYQHRQQKLAQRRFRSSRVTCRCTRIFQQQHDVLLLRSSRCCHGGGWNQPPGQQLETQVSGGLTAFGIQGLVLMPPFYMFAINFSIFNMSKRH